MLESIFILLLPSLEVNPVKENYQKYKGLEDQMFIMGKFFTEFFRKTMTTEGMSEKADFSMMELKGLSAFLEIENEYTMSELSNNAHLTLPNMTTIVDGLLKKGIAKRRRDKQDRRIVRVSLTEKGKKMVRDFMSKRATELEKSLGSLSEKDIKDLFNAMDTATRILRKINLKMKA